MYSCSFVCIYVVAVSQSILSLGPGLLWQNDFTIILLTSKYGIYKICIYIFKFKTVVTVVIWSYFDDHTEMIKYVKNTQNEYFCVYIDISSWIQVSLLIEINKIENLAKQDSTNRGFHSSVANLWYSLIVGNHPFYHVT